jgi:SET domain-containing protein
LVAHDDLATFMDPWRCRQSDLIEVRRTDARGRGGRGVFALRDIPAGTLIERTPVLLIPRNQVFSADPKVRAASARISWYVFDWSGQTKRDYVALALGYGSIYNHSDDPNAAFEPEPPDTLAFRATRDIPADAEVFISYRGAGENPHPLGFEPEA